MPKKEDIPLEQEIVENQVEEEEILVEDESEPLELESELGEPKGHLCPFCKEVQDEWIYRKSKKGWAECPNCGKFIRRGDIPPEYIVEQPDELEPKTRKDQETSEDEDEDVYEDTSDLYEDDDAPHEDDDDVYREPVSPHKSLEKVLTHHGVNKKASNMIVTRCKRMGEMHESDLERMLYDLKTGVGNKAIKYIIEDYVLELENESERLRSLESSRDYSPSRRRPSSRFDSPSRQRPRGGRGEWGGTPWDKRGGDSEQMSRDEVLEFIEKRDRERDRQLATEKKDEEILKLREVSARLEQKLEDFEENPPSSISEDTLTKADLAEAKSSDYIKALELQLQTQQEERKREADERREELRIMREEQKESRERFEREAKDSRERHEKQTEKLQGKVEDEQRRAQDIATSKTGDYSRDEMKLVAEGLSKLGSIVERRGPPIRQIGEILPQLQQIMGQGTGQPPVRERMGPSSVADLVAEEQPNLVRQ